MSLARFIGAIAGFAAAIALVAFIAAMRRPLLTASAVCFAIALLIL